MDDETGPESLDRNERSLPMALAMGAAFGTAFGVLVFAITGDAIWIALSPGFGVTVALLYHVISEET